MFYSILWFSDHSKIWFKQMFNLRVRSARISEVNASTPIYIWGETDSRSRWCLSINIICFIVQERTFLNFKDFKIYLHNRVHCVFKFLIVCLIQDEVEYHSTCFCIQDMWNKLERLQTHAIHTHTHTHIYTDAHTHTLNKQSHPHTQTQPHTLICASELTFTSPKHFEQ